MTELEHGDPTMHPYWEAARNGELAAQHCGDCGAWQFYARPFCLICWSDDVRWKPTNGVGTVYSKAVVRLKVIAELDPPYTVGIVELDEGPRLLTNFVEGDCEIGARVKVRWRERENNLPPLAVFGETDL